MDGKIPNKQKQLYYTIKHVPENNYNIKLFKTILTWMV